MIGFGFGVDRDDSFAIGVHLALYRRNYVLGSLVLGLGPWGTLTVTWDCPERVSR